MGATYRVLIVVHSLSQNRAERHGGESTRLLPHSSDLKQGPEGWREHRLVRLHSVFPNRTMEHKCGGSSPYAACRWGSCWPGNAACLRRSCTDTGVCRAGWACLAGLTNTQHTRCCCRCSHRPTAAWEKRQRRLRSHRRGGLITVNHSRL